MEFRVTNNIDQFKRGLNLVQREQIPYAASRAINDTAVDAQEAVQEAIPHIFENRKKWWLKRQPTGIKVKFSNKKNLHAQVFTNAYFAKIQAEGGTKKPKTARNLAIPTKAVPNRYRTSHGAREMVADRGNVFRNEKGVFKRTGKRKITLLWSFSPSASITRVFNFHEIIQKVVKRRFSKHFEKRLNEALASAKRPSR